MFGRDFVRCFVIERLVYSLVIVEVDITFNGLMRFGKVTFPPKTDPVITSKLGYIAP